MSEERKYPNHTLAELLAMEAAATPGPVMVERCYDGARTVCQLRSIDSTVCINVESDRLQVYAKTDENAALLAASRNALRPMVERIAELEAHASASCAVESAQQTLVSRQQDRIAQLEADLATASRGYTERTKQLQAQLSAAMERLCELVPLSPPAPMLVSLPPDEATQLLRREIEKIEKLEAELAAAREDSARLDALQAWLLSRPGNILCNPPWGVRGYRDAVVDHNAACDLCAPDLRAAIDAARGAK